jgi:hypothetical protein
MKHIPDNKANEIANNLGYKNAHDLKREFNTNSNSDIFVDKRGNVYLGNKNGKGDAEFVGKMKDTQNE